MKNLVLELTKLSIALLIMILEEKLLGMSSRSISFLPVNYLSLILYFKAERKRIVEEVNLIKALKHKNIIHFISAWANKVKEELIFITEMVTGGSLKQYRFDLTLIFF